jgi:hypothetical protein
MTSVKADEQGKFELHNVPPGPHTLAIFGGNRISIKTGTNSTMGTTGSASAGADDGSMGYAPITMPNADLENITLTVSAPGTIQGKIQIEGGIEAATAELKARITTPQNLPPDILSRMTALPTVRLNSFAKVGVGNSGNTRNDGTQPDGSFSLGAVSRGVYYVAMDSSIQSQGYYVRSMSFDGTDISRAPLEFNGGSGELVITMAKGAAEITGTAAAGGVTVSLWPQTPDRSSATGNIKTTTADQNGAFKFTNVPPGDYHAVGFAQLPETGLGQYAPYLAALNGEATSIRLQPNTPANASVKVISAEKAAEVAAKLP